MIVFCETLILPENPTPMPQLTTYELHLKQYHDMEQRRQQKLAPPVFEENLQRDWKRDLYLSQVSYTRTSPKWGSLVERLVAVIIVAAIIGIAVMYHNEIRAVLAGGRG